MRIEQVGWLLLVAACGVAALGSCKDPKPSDAKASDDDDSGKKRKKKSGADGGTTAAPLRPASGGKFSPAGDAGNEASMSAKMQVGAISRGGMAAYEREVAMADDLAEGDEMEAPSHELCGTAVPVPTTVPRRQTYQASPKAGEDFNSGDSTTGWTCLRFSVDQPMYYQLRYTKNGSAVPNNPDACHKNCFEAAAFGDLDGDGIQSVFARNGHVDPTTGKLKMATQIYAENETE